MKKVYKVNSNDNNERKVCQYCQDHVGQPSPPHFASPDCESGGYNHCSCDICF